MVAFELRGQCLQIGVADTKPLHLLHGGEHVVAAGARPAMTLSRVVQLFREAQPSSVLAMSPIDDITQRMHAFLRAVVEPNPPPSLTIDPGYLFAGAQVLDCFASAGQGPLGKRCRGSCRRDPVRTPGRVFAEFRDARTSRRTARDGRSQGVR